MKVFLYLFLKLNIVDTADVNWNGLVSVDVLLICFVIYENINP